jgi:hypothetical protein
VEAGPAAAQAEDGPSPPVNWQQGPLHIDLSASNAEDGSRLNGKSSLQVDLSSVKAAVTGTLEMSKPDPGDGISGLPAAIPTNDFASPDKGRVDFNAAWSGPDSAHVAVAAHEQVSQTLMPLVADPGTDTVRPMQWTEERAAQVTSALSLFGPVGAEFSAAATSATTRDTAQALISGEVAPTRLDTATNEEAAKLTWQAVPQLRLEAGAGVEHVDTDWRGTADSASALTYVKPELAATLGGWSGGDVRVGWERVVSPLDSGDYSALANVGHSNDLSVEPDQQWQYDAKLTQHIGAAVASASYSNGYDGTAIETARVDADVQAPASVALRGREQTGFSLSMPLDLFGLSGTALQSSGAWSWSSVRDPVTGEFRGASGDIAQQTDVRLVHDLPGARAQIGVSGHLVARQDFYQVSQLTTLETSPSLGVFFSYRPGPFQLDLKLDGLVGGTQRYTDYLYDGGRDGLAAGMDAHQEGGANFSLSLRKPF